jgi:AmmeMemoRadiSam system protein B
MRVRPAAVAGRFYPGDADALAALVDRLLAAAPAASGPRPVAVVAPHAGFHFSGRVAAAAYAPLVPWRGAVSRVVVLGPAHLVPLRGMAVPGVDAFATPLGAVPVDPVARTLPGVAVDDAPHAGEHSLETQLPFLLRALGPGVPVVPVVVGSTPPAQVAALLAGLLDDPAALAVVSTDLSHYLAREQAQERDARTAAAVVARDGTALRPADACGYHPLRGLLRHAADRRLAVEVRRLGTSADAGADPGRVVGYGAFLLHADLQAGGSRAAVVRLRSSSANRHSSAP